jgi:hypothetical protein
MKLNSDVPARSSRKIFILLGAVVLLAAGTAVGWHFYNKGKHTPRPLKPDDARSVIAKYLQEKTGKSEFKCVVDISKERNPWQALKSQFDAPPDYKTVYRTIGEHLSVVEKLLKSADEKEQINGVRVAGELAQVSNEVAVDPWLGARICDAYIVPNLEKLPKSPKYGPSRDQMTRYASHFYRTADEPNPTSIPGDSRRGRDGGGKPN